MAGVVAARCGSHSFQYQRETVGQSFAVESHRACTQRESGGMLGSANACGTSRAVQRSSVRPLPSGTSAARVTVLLKVWRRTAWRTGFPAGWSTVTTVERMGAVYSRMLQSAHVPFMRGLRVRRAKRTWRISPTARPGMAQLMRRWRGSTMFEPMLELSVAVLSVRAKSTVRTCPFVPTISTQKMAASQ